ncbi:HlyD family type I secretion periplasmic adaptor subunit [Kordiimonas sediminis]|uniref:Membrane fusion protein (MFP) family protein n=1 Tax=Kordiimonas sediminis TaxID=1735581 RepID=A0A919ATI8_9PROT|nr:HlyD family type I secretion periplasmic adaptor subunit [Kordiimonas sediminis]GHF25562.1 HlyD family type I secretion periplasmic adaptor subunit [Kordiimonas sediminis]
MSRRSIPQGEVFDTVRSSKEPYITDKVRLGGIFAGAFFVFLILWSVFAPLATGSVVTGRVTVEGDRDILQHLEGGRVTAINVSNGQKVAAGTVLLELDTKMARARLRDVMARYVATAAKHQRLLNEYDGSDALSFSNLYESKQLSPEVVANILMLEQKQFEMRNALYLERDDALYQAIAAIEDVQKNLVKQLSNVTEQLRLLDEEIVDVDSLLAKGLAPKSRSLALKRTKETVLAQELSLKSQMAETSSRLADTRVERATFVSQYKQEIAAMIQEASVELESLIAARDLAIDEFERTSIVAPRDGFVMNIKPKTRGEVIERGETIMEIVPEGANLIISGELRAEDANRIEAGLPASITILAFKGRAAPTLKGRVKFVSPDVVTDEQTGMSYYPIQIVLEEESVSTLTAENELQPGLPAQVVVETAKQPIISYLLAPITSTIRNAFTEQ